MVGCPRARIAIPLEECFDYGAIVGVPTSHWDCFLNRQHVARGSPGTSFRGPDVADLRSEICGKNDVFAR